LSLSMASLLFKEALLLSRAGQRIHIGGVGVGGVGVTTTTTTPRAGFHTTAPTDGKHNFRKFHMGNKRGSRIFRKKRNAGDYPDIPVETAVKPMGFLYEGKHHVVPEMVPEFIVPDLTDFHLKPYVSYRAGNTYQEEFTARDLYQHVYFGKLEKDFREGNLDQEGNPKVLSPEEQMTPEEAWILARKTGSDIFSERIPKLWECLDIDIATWQKERAAQYNYDHYADFMKLPYDPEMEAVDNVAMGETGNDSKSSTGKDSTSPSSDDTRNKTTS